jgi:hypothetical protein
MIPDLRFENSERASHPEDGRTLMHEKRMALVVVCLFAVLIFTGCPAIDTKELNYTRSKPAVSDLIGTWTPDRSSMDEILNRGGYTNIQPAITLRAEGTFSIRDMPDWWSDGFGASHGKVESLDGKWALEKEKEVWDVWIISLRTGEAYRSVHLYRQKPPLAIFVRVGDPNEGDAMIFERSKPE